MESSLIETMLRKTIGKQLAGILWSKNTSWIPANARKGRKKAGQFTRSALPPNSYATSCHITSCGVYIMVIFADEHVNLSE